MNEQLRNLKLLLGIDAEDEEQDELLELYLNQAMDEILSFCNRTDLVGGMQYIILDLAVIRFNRAGTEGETSRTEGGVSQSFIEGLPSNSDWLDSLWLLKLGWCLLDDAIEG